MLNTLIIGAALIAISVILWWTVKELKTLIRDPELSTSMKWIIVIGVFASGILASIIFAMTVSLIKDGL